MLYFTNADFHYMDVGTLIEDAAYAAGFRELATYYNARGLDGEREAFGVYPRGAEVEANVEHFLAHFPVIRERLRVAVRAVRRREGTLDNWWLYGRLAYYVRNGH